MNKIDYAFIAASVIVFTIMALFIPVTAHSGETYGVTLTLPLDLSKAKKLGTISFSVSSEHRDYNSYTTIDNSVSNATTSTSTTTNNDFTTKTTNNNTSSTTNNNFTTNTTNNNNSSTTHINQNHNGGIIIN